MIIHFKTFFWFQFSHFKISKILYPRLQTIADIPSGDMGWQMAVRHLNTAKLYFGGEIAKSVAEDNARRYKSHATWMKHPMKFLRGPNGWLV